MLLAGDVWVTTESFMAVGSRTRRRYLRLTFDQTALVWTPWRDDEGAEDEDSSSARSTTITDITCVTESAITAGSPVAKLVLQLGSKTKTLVFEGLPEKVSAWAAALQRLVAIVRQRRSYEMLYGGAETSDDMHSPRTLAVSSSKVRELLKSRQESLTNDMQMKIMRRKAASAGRAMDAMGASNGHLNGHSNSNGHQNGTINGGGAASGSSGAGGDGPQRLDPDRQRSMDLHAEMRLKYGLLERSSSAVKPAGHRRLSQ